MDGSVASAGNPWTSELNDNDVLLGRGAVILKTEGHIRFRRLIQENKPEYTASGRHSVKNEIAMRILATISSRGGRFVRKLESDTDKAKYGAPSESDAYLIVGEEASLQKIKQALREQDASGKSAHGPRKRKADRLERDGREDAAPSPITDAAQPSHQDFATLPTSSPSEVRQTTGSVSSAPSDQDLEFRLKHPSLRKRDLSRLRRQQGSALSEGKAGPMSVESLQGMLSVPLAPAARPAHVVPIRSSEGKAEESDDDDTVTTRKTSDK